MGARLFSNKTSKKSQNTFTNMTYIKCEYKSDDFTNNKKYSVTQSGYTFIE